MNTREIREVIKIMNENGLVEFEIEREGLRMRLKKESKGEIVTHVEHPSLQLHTKEAPKVAMETPRNLVEIKAPMVGTFYRAPAPNAQPFVEVGSEIAKDQVVCIIEAMKLMNEIKSEVKGKVVEILVENGEPVEFGHVLFLIEPAG